MSASIPAEAARHLQQLDAADPEAEALLGYALSNLPALLPVAFRQMADQLDARAAGIAAAALFSDDQDAADALTGLVLTALLNAAEPGFRRSRPGQELTH